LFLFLVEPAAIPAGVLKWSAKVVAITFNFQEKWNLFFIALSQKIGFQ